MTFDVEGISNLFQEPPFLVLTRHSQKWKQDRWSWVNALQVYDLESHQELKTIESSRESYNLLTNESVVVTVTGMSVLIYNKKMLLDPNIPPEAIKTQEIPIFPTSHLSLSRTSIVFSPCRHSKGEEGSLQALNFWLERERERDQLDVKEHAESDQQAK